MRAAVSVEGPSVPLPSGWRPLQLVKVRAGDREFTTLSETLVSLGPNGAAGLRGAEPSRGCLLTELFSPPYPLFDAEAGAHVVPPSVAGPDAFDAVLDFLRAGEWRPMRDGVEYADVCAAAAVLGIREQPLPPPPPLERRSTTDRRFEHIEVVVPPQRRGGGNERTQVSEEDATARAAPPPSSLSVVAALGEAGFKVCAAAGERNGAGRVWMRRKTPEVPGLTDLSPNTEPAAVWLAALRSAA